MQNLVNDTVTVILLGKRAETQRVQWGFEPQRHKGTAVITSYF